MNSKSSPNFFLTPVFDLSRSTPALRFWLGLSFAIALFYSFLALQQAFSQPYVVQDDARQHVFWMRRFLDPELFPQDLIADYFQSIAPAGYAGLYRVGALLGLDPILLSKLLPAGLGLITTAYGFGLALELFPVPAGACAACLFLNQALWTKDDLVSATPRAFVYPLLVAFLYYLVRRKLWLCIGAIALQGLFYPQAVLISAAILCVRLLDWRQGWPRGSGNREDSRFAIAGLSVAFLILLPFALQSSEFGPVATRAEALQIPEFAEGGRAFFFVNNPFEFWLTKERSGLFPESLLRAPLILIGLVLPWLLRRPQGFPLAQRVHPAIALLPQIFLASFGLFLIAHALIFRLQLPSRYTHYTLRIGLALAAGITLTLLVDAGLRGWNQRFGQRLGWGTALLGSILLVGYPLLIADFPDSRYKVGDSPALYEFLAQQPKDTLIASLSEEASVLPTFAQRSVLTAWEYDLPYHLGYYQQFRQRMEDLIQAQYSPDLERVQDFIQTYGIDFFLLDSGIWNPEFVASDRWIQQYQPLATEIQQQLAQGAVSALERVTPQCQVPEIRDRILLNARCVATLQDQAP